MYAGQRAVTNGLDESGRPRPSTSEYTSECHSKRVIQSGTFILTLTLILN